MKLIIFSEGGNDFGLGHISRCSALYDEVKNRGILVEFVVNGNIKEVDFLKGRKVENINWLSEAYLNNKINNDDYCIVDSYLVSEKICDLISIKSKKTLFIDDICRIKYPLKSIIVNPSLCIDGLSYSLNDGSIYLLGAEYIILRNSFINTIRGGINKDIKEVLVTMGGSDIRCLTLLIINSICVKYSYIHFNIVVGKAFKNINLIESIELNNIDLHYDLNAELMGKLMLRSDFAITAAGQTIYELLATQTPFIPIKIIDNQNNNIKGLKNINPYQVVIEFDNKLLIERLEIEFINMLKLNNRMDFNNRYSNCIDGFGSKRIIDNLLIF